MLKTLVKLGGINLYASTGLLHNLSMRSVYKDLLCTILCMNELLAERSAASDAPSSGEFGLIANAAFDTDDYTRQVEDLFITYASGRLGLRSGELLHFLNGVEDDWLDQDRKIIYIPKVSNCKCRYCRGRAEEVAARQDDMTMEDVLELYWQPKYKASIRAIPYGWDANIIDAVERFTNDVGGFSCSQSTINRRVNTLQDRAEIKGNLYPHALRAAAAFFWAERGLEAVYLQALMGWRDMRVANRYIRATGQQLKNRVADLMDVNNDENEIIEEYYKEDLPDPTEHVYDRTGRAQTQAKGSATQISQWVES